MSNIVSYNQIVKAANREVAPPFVWKTKDDERLMPSQMTTSHLFYTMRMVWNHRMPAKMQIVGCNRYVFSAFYSDDYLLEAIKQMGAELAREHRLKELPEWMLEQLRFMALHMQAYAQYDFLTNARQLDRLPT